MHEDYRDDHEWEHWPGRKTDDRLTDRLRSLFAPTEGDDAVDAMISERGREIEEQALRLQATVEGLERREEQAARLRSTVEEMLREGAAELDERHAELSAAAAQLEAREARVAEAEREIAVRRQELGAVELRRAAVERREEAATEREGALADAAAEVRRRTLEIFDAENADAGSAAGAPEHSWSVDEHIVFVHDAAFRMIELPGPPPALGAEVELDGRRYVVVRLGGWSVPGDRRGCAYVEPPRDHG